MPVVHLKAALESNIDGTLKTTPKRLRLRVPPSGTHVGVVFFADTLPVEICVLHQPQHCQGSLARFTHWQTSSRNSRRRSSNSGASIRFFNW